MHGGPSNAEKECHRSHGEQGMDSPEGHFPEMQG